MPAGAGSGNLQDDVMWLLTGTTAAVGAGDEVQPERKAAPLDKTQREVIYCQ
jgi:hypothetical protein